MESGRAEVGAGTVVPEAKRRRRSIAERRRVVEETLAPGASVARIARTHGINANQVFHWRRLYHRGLLGGKVRGSVGLLPVTVSESAETVAMVAKGSGAAAGMHARAASAIQIELAKGRVRIEGSPNAELLRVVLECLRG
jgi:transposase